ncbi:MAG: hypothetical protein LBL87_06735 [Ruminococcus sp.]|nr:hypothetical protein [Ruminococcus sp.]
MRKLIKSSAFIIAAFIILKVFGLLREVVLAYVYGAGALTDAYVIARSVPDTLAGIAAASAGSVFITVSAGLQRENEKSRFTRILITLFCAFGALLTVFIAAFPDFFINIFAANPAPDVAEKTVSLLRVMSLVCIPSFANAILAANLQAKGQFFRAAVYQVTVNIFVIAFIFIGKAAGIDTLIGIGFSAGYICSAILLLIFNKAAGFSYFASRENRAEKILFDKNIKAFFVLLIPALLSAAVPQLFQAADRAVSASPFFEIGTVSALSYAAKIESVFVLLIGTTAATAFLPDLTKSIAEGEIEQAKKQIGNAFRAVMIVAIPLTVGVMLFSHLIIRILLQRGEFSAADTAKTAQLLFMYAAGLAPQCASPLLAAVLLALRETKALIAVSLTALVVGALLKILLWGSAPLLAFSTSVAAYVFAGLLFFMLRRKKIDFSLRFTKSDIEALIEYVKSALARKGEFR